MEPQEIAVLVLLAFIVIRIIRKDRSDGRGLLGGTGKSTPPKQKK